MENADICKASFLDFSIKDHDRKFTIELFDKREALSFYISHPPYLHNIPWQIFYAPASSEIYRIISRTTTDLINMVIHVNLLLIHMKKQGGEYTCLWETL